jgi:hypothetical protein
MIQLNKDISIDRHNAKVMHRNSNEKKNVCSESQQFKCYELISHLLQDFSCTLKMEKKHFPKYLGPAKSFDIDRGLCYIIITQILHNITQFRNV